MGKSGKTMTGAKPPFEPPFFYGWVVVAASAITLFFSGPGQTYSVSIFIDSFIAEFGWSRSLVSTMYSSGTLVAGLIIAGVGRYFDIFGHRKMTTVVAAAFGLALIGMSFVGSLPALLVGFFCIRLLGQGSMSLASTTLVPQWFIKKRGRALSLVSIGGGLSAAFFPPVNTWLIANLGWQSGWQVWGMVMWLAMVPLGWFLVRDRPEKVGLKPDGQKSPNDSGISPQKGSIVDDVKTPAEAEFTVRQAVRTKVFWLLLFCTTIPSALGTGMTFHQISIMQQLGVSTAVAASVLSIMALTRLPMIFAAGQLADRFPVRYLIAVSLALLAVSMAVLLTATSATAAVIYGVLRGLSMGITAVAGGVVWPNYFGRKHLGSIRGLAMTCMVIGSSLGPLPFGFAYDVFGGYGEILTVTILLPVLGVAAAALARPPGPQALASAQNDSQIPADN